MITESEEQTKYTNTSKFSKMQNITQQSNFKSYIPNNSKTTNDFLIDTPLNSDENKKANNIKNNKAYLDLEVINSWILPQGLLLHFNNEGLENSLRNMKDGITYFGFLKNNNQYNNNNEIDYIINPKDEEYDDNRYVGKHFKIEYCENDNKYYIQDLGFGYGTFIKIFSGNEKYEPYIFKSDINKTILIGRDYDCDISIEDKRLSRIHCNINYDINNKIWLLKDGNKNSNSTNGTWLYAAENYQIYDGMVFKTNHNLFKCKYKFDEL